VLAIAVSKSLPFSSAKKIERKWKIYKLKKLLNEINWKDFHSNKRGNLHFKGDNDRASKIDFIFSSNILCHQCLYPYYLKIFMEYFSCIVIFSFVMESLKFLWAFQYTWDVKGIKLSIKWIRGKTIWWKSFSTNHILSNNFESLNISWWKREYLILWFCSWQHQILSLSISYKIFTKLFSLWSEWYWCFSKSLFVSIFKCELKFKFPLKLRIWLGCQGRRNNKFIIKFNFQI